MTQVRDKCGDVTNTVRNFFGALNRGKFLGSVKNSYFLKECATFSWLHIYNVFFIFLFNF